jgi:hypothetical protein
MSNDARQCFPLELVQEYRSTRRENSRKEQSPRGYRAYIELFFRSTFFSSVVVVLGPLAQLVSSDVKRRSAVIAINLFFIAALYASRVPRKACDS